MKLELVTFKTYPSKKDKFWQLVLLPTVSVLGNEENKDEYKILLRDFNGNYANPFGLPELDLPSMISVSPSMEISISFLL